MAKYKNYVGVTETGDPGIYWRDMKPLHQSNVLITKHLENPDFRQFLLDNKSKIILHATITGYGSTPYEPGVISKEDSIHYIRNLVDRGFPIEQLVFRTDPIIPTELGIKYWEDNIVYFMNNIIDYYHKNVRVRLSVLDFYKHIRSRIVKFEPEIMKYYNGFNPKPEVFRYINDAIKYFKDLRNEFLFESCAEPLLTECEQVGCVSQKDIDILGLSDKVELVGKSHQRSTCLCPDNKIQLLGGYKSIKKCTSNCKYCYLRGTHD